MFTAVILWNQIVRKVHTFPAEYLVSLSASNLTASSFSAPIHRSLTGTLLTRAGGFT